MRLIIIVLIFITLGVTIGFGIAYVSGNILYPIRAFPSPPADILSAEWQVYEQSYRQAKLEHNEHTQKRLTLGMWCILGTGVIGALFGWRIASNKKSVHDANPHIES